MTGNLLDHFIFKSRRVATRAKWIVFVLIAGGILGTFWWFRAVAWGIQGEWIFLSSSFPVLRCTSPVLTMLGIA